MSEIALTERLAQAIVAMLGNPDTPVTATDPQVTELLGIAAGLRALPRPAFKARLRQELERETSMNNTAAKRQSGDKSPHSKIRAGFRTVTPYLTVADVHEEIEFVSRAFGATGTIYGLGSAGGFHSEYKIGDSMIMIGGGGTGASWKGSPAPGSLHLYVEDVDAVYERALQAGATSLMAPTDQEYGDRDAAVIDVGGNHWYIGTHQGATYKPEGVSDLMPYLHPTGAPKMMNFLKQAFRAEEIFVYQSPDGIVHHAKVGIGNSIVEMGEAHAQWVPMPMVFMLYVENADDWYARAMNVEGTISISAPADQPYGDRVGTVKDPFGNTWYIGQQPTAGAEDSTLSGGTHMIPKLFRIALQVSDLDKAATFYAKLLDDGGTRIPRGARHYFDCGPVILALVDVAAGGEQPQPGPDYIYFAVSNLAQVYERAKALNCLAKDSFHDQNAGEIVKRPWGELSFYVEDPWGNGLCFVDEGTLFTGR